MKTAGVILLVGIACAILGATPYLLVFFAYAPGFGLVPAAVVVAIWVLLIRRWRRQDPQKGSTRLNQKGSQVMERGHYLKAGT